MQIFTVHACTWFRQSMCFTVNHTSNGETSTERSTFRSESMLLQLGGSIVATLMDNHDTCTQLQWDRDTRSAAVPFLLFLAHGVFQPHHTHQFLVDDTEHPCCCARLKSSEVYLNIQDLQHRRGLEEPAGRK